MFSSTCVQTLPHPATSLCERIMQKSESDSLNLQARHVAICSTQQLSLTLVVTVVLVSLTIVVLLLTFVATVVLVSLTIVVLMLVAVLS